MAQEGSYVKRNGWWLLRYRESVVENGELKRMLRSRKLALLSHYPPKRQRKKNGAANGTKFDDVPDAVKVLARQYLDPANNQERKPEQVRRLGEFIESVYLPWVTEQLRPSTVKEYKGIWNRHLKARCSDRWLREVRTYHVNLWLNDIAKQNRKLTTSSLQRVKNFLSGVFTAAKNQGFHDDINPVVGAELPKAAKSRPTHAYGLQEIFSIMDTLEDDPLALTIVAVAAFAGLSRTEIRGLRWEEYNSQELQVVRGVWESHVGDPKTEARRDTVPVILPLREKLEQWHKHCNKPREGWMFASESNTPVHLGNLINRNILPALDACMICGKVPGDHGKGEGQEKHEYRRDNDVPKWRGFHAFRRGLATNLSALEVPTELIRLILRHSKVQTTQEHYIKPSKDEVKKAMAKFELHWTTKSKEYAALAKQPATVN